MKLPNSLVQKLKNRRSRKRAVKAPGVDVQKTTQVKYEQVLRKLAREIHQSLLSELKSQLEKSEITDEMRLINDGILETLRRIIREQQAKAKKLTASAQRFAQKTAEDVDKSHRRKFLESVRKSVGIDLSKILDKEDVREVLNVRIKENVDLIKSIPAQYFSSVHDLVSKAPDSERGAASMIKNIQDLGGQTERRARLIARDQTQKLNSAITEIRQTNLGISEYEWQTSGDERVRDSHRRNNGKIFKWAEPPATGHPGKDVNCRCVALPIIDLETLI